MGDPRTLPTIAVDLRALVPEATGIGVYTRSLMLALARRGGARYVGMAHRPPRGAEELRAAGVELEHQAMPLGVAWQQLALPRRLGKGDVDLFFSPLGILPLRCPVPSVVTVHDLTVLLLPETHRLKVRLSQLPFLRSTLDRATRVVADSRSTAEDLRVHFPQCAGRVRVICPGIDPDFQPGSPEAIAATREGLGCPDGYILYAGTLEPRKNLACLLDAWETLRDEEPETTPPLVLAGPYGWGSARLVRRLERVAARAPVQMLGRLCRQRLVEVFQGARIFAYPSLYEGFGLPPAEAMACGIPTVVSRASSLPEVVGEAGLTVAPDSPEELAGALRRLLRDGELAADLADAGRQQSRLFTWERAAEAFEETFREALPGNSGPPHGSLLG